MSRHISKNYKEWAAGFPAALFFDVMTDQCGVWGGTFAQTPDFSFREENSGGVEYRLEL
jgi:hypothetical protein